MHLHELRSPEGARHKKQRVGRGTGSGRGKTSGRGQKGQLARGDGFRLGFEGGQLPLAQRLPKLGGFKNPCKVVYRPINLSKLNRFQPGTEVTPDLLYEAGLVNAGEEYKVLAAGKLGRKLTVSAHAFSEGARAAIEKAGGTVTVIGGAQAPVDEAEVEAREARARAKAGARAEAKEKAEADAEAEPAAEAATSEEPEKDPDGKPE